jgi:hypothetical protein
MGKWRMLAVLLALQGLVACGGEEAGAVTTEDGGADVAGSRCGGIAGRPCGPADYCDLGVGQCKVADATGVCKRKPRACPYLYAPVCGCDGKTYSNSCMAAAAGMAIDHVGACATPPKPCGGIAGLKCDAGQYCKYEVGACRTPDAMGACTALPELCPSLYQPVCGCDDRTYPNDCAAAVSGYSVAYAGACGTKPRQCGGLAGLPCAAGQFCQLPAGQCNVADAMGVCVTTGGYCTMNYDPVCGCDRHTYGNACSAAMSGVNVDYTGACRLVP